MKDLDFWMNNKKKSPEKKSDNVREKRKTEKPKSQSKNKRNSAIGFEDKLWKAADKLRGNMDSAEYKHVVLGLIFLKYISDSFEEKYNELKSEEYADPEDKDEYTAENIFWVPKNARWSVLRANSKDPKIGLMVDEAMELIEKNNPKLKGILPKNYARKELDKIVLGGVIDLISDIGLGDKEHRSRDILGQVYEYFLGKFAAQEGKGGGEFFTPTCIVRLLVEIIEPYKGRIYDPCCGSGGMFVQSERFIEVHGGSRKDIAIYGQESNPTTWKLAQMNLAIRQIDANLGPKFADSFHNDLHPSLKADYILANPPFNMKDWGGNRLKEDVRWKYGTSPSRNANYAWIQHIIHHLAPTGIAGFVMANGSLTTTTSAEKKIRKLLVKNDLVDCIVALPTQLFLTTQIPACLWFIVRKKDNKNTRSRRWETLFIDASEMGQMIDRKTRVLTDEEIQYISSIYHQWKSLDSENSYQDILGLCKTSNLKEIEENEFILTPSRYVGIPIELDKIEFVQNEIKNLYDKLDLLEEENDSLRQKIKLQIEKLFDFL